MTWWATNKTRSLRLPSWWRWSPQRSLAVKLTLTMTGLVVIAISGVTALSIRREQNTFHQDWKERASLLLDTLEVVARDPLYDLKADVLSQLISALAQNHPLLTSGRIYDSDGRIIADLHQQGPVYATQSSPLGQRLINSDGTSFTWQSQQLVAGRAIMAGDQRLGAVSIGLSTAPLQQKIARVRNQGIFIALMAGSLGATIAVVLSRSITTPLQTLVGATRKIAQGDLNQQVPIQSQDELAVLAQSFNEMTSRLQQTLSLLQAHKDELEQRVQERTQELSEALHHLQQTQTQLVQSEKMSSLGQLVAGVAHEINNPASFIHGNLTYASTYIKDLLDIITLYQQHYPNPPANLQDAIDTADLTFIQSDLPKLLQSMQVGSDRINEIVRSLRTFSRLEEGDFKPADVHDGIDSTLMILKHRLKMAPGNGIQVVKHYADLAPIECHLGQLNQVFMNILTNAIDALQDQAATPSSPSRQLPTIEIRTQSLSPGWIAIHIFNNGPSIDTEIHSKLFDPFFTTKSVGQGTGLGLSISYQIVTEHHGGRLYCHSKADWGTEFIIELPTHHREGTRPDWAAAEP